MTGLPAALSALAFASTASVADSVIAAMRREMRRSAGGRSADSAAASRAVMCPWCQRDPSPTAGGRVPAPQPDVADRPRRGEFHALPAVQRAVEVVEEPLAGTQKDRDHDQVQLVDQPRPQENLDGGHAAAQPDV